MRLIRLAAAVSFATLVAMPAAAQVTPQALAKLEALHASKPDDAKASRALGIALFKLHRYPDAERVLTEASVANPGDGLSALYLGMACEEQNKLTAARAAYSKYLATGKTKSAKDDVVLRMAALAQKELAADAKNRVTNEQRLAGTPSDAQTIAVLPIQVTGDPQWEPLGRGLADLMIADFGKTNLKLLERDRVQAILDEIALGRSNQVDQATRIRSGKLLQAGRLVTGNLTVANAANTQLNTSVVNVTSTQSVAGGSSSGALARVFDAEKAVVLSTLQSMGVAVTAAQRAAINDYRPTQNIQAFLAFSRGLVASDAGRLDEAANFFDNAHALDPNFAAAVTRAASARSGQAGQAVTTGQIETKLRGSAEGQVVSAAERGTTGGGFAGSLGSTIQNALADVNPSSADAIGRASTSASNRDPASSTTGADVTASTKVGTLTIVIKRP